MAALRTTMSFMRRARYSVCRGCGWLRFQRRGERPYAEFGVQLGRVIGIAILQHQRHIANRRNIARRITVDEDQVGALAPFDRATIGEHARISRTVPGGNAQDLVGWNSGLDVELEF